MANIDDGMKKDMRAKLGLDEESESSQEVPSDEEMESEEESAPSEEMEEEEESESAPLPPPKKKGKVPFNKAKAWAGFGGK